MSAQTARPLTLPIPPGCSACTIQAVACSGGDRVRRLEAPGPGRGEAVPGIVAGVAEHEHQHHACGRELIQSRLDEAPADAVPLVVRVHRQRRKDRRGHRAFSPGQPCVCVNRM